jgi:hypothetical protein
MSEPITQSKVEANEYCQSIVQEVLALEELIENAKNFDDDLEDPLRELWLELASSVGEDASNYKPCVVDYVNQNCLEFIVLGERSSATNEWSVVGARLLITYGGPNAYIEWRDTNIIVVEVYWGREFAQERILAPNIAVALGEIAEAAV